MENQTAKKSRTTQEMPPPTANNNNQLAVASPEDEARAAFRDRKVRAARMAQFCNFPKEMVAQIAGAPDERALMAVYKNRGAMPVTSAAHADYLKQWLAREEAMEPYAEQMRRQHHDLFTLVNEAGEERTLDINVEADRALLAARTGGRVYIANERAPTAQERLRELEAAHAAPDDSMEPAHQLVALAKQKAADIAQVQRDYVDIITSEEGGAGRKFAMSVNALPGSTERLRNQLPVGDSMPPILAKYHGFYNQLELMMALEGFADTLAYTSNLRMMVFGGPHPRAMLTSDLYRTYGALIKHLQQTDLAKTHEELLQQLEVDNFGKGGAGQQPSGKRGAAPPPPASALVNPLRQGLEAARKAWEEDKIPLTPYHQAAPHNVPERSVEEITGILTSNCVAQQSIFLGEVRELVQQHARGAFPGVKFYYELWHKMQAYAKNVVMAQEIALFMFYPDIGNDFSLVTRPEVVKGHLVEPPILEALRAKRAEHLADLRRIMGGHEAEYGREPFASEVALAEGTDRAQPVCPAGDPDHAYCPTVGQMEELWHLLCLDVNHVDHEEALLQRMEVLLEEKEGGSGPAAAAADEDEVME